MTWIKLDDKTPRHPKVAGLSDRAKWAWLSSLCYASEFLTDGVVPMAFIVTVSRRLREEIVAAGLWREAGNQIVIHDYLDHQTSKESVQKERRRNRERRNAGRTSGTPAGRTEEKPRPDTEIRDQITEHPQTPVGTGAVRIRQRDYDKADRVRKAWNGWCQHKPTPCADAAACRELLAREIALSRKAS